MYRSGSFLLPPVEKSTGEYTNIEMSSIITVRHVGFTEVEVLSAAAPTILLSTRREKIHLCSGINTYTDTNSLSIMAHRPSIAILRAAFVSCWTTFRGARNVIQLVSNASSVLQCCFSSTAADINITIPFVSVFHDLIVANLFDFSLFISRLSSRIVTCHAPAFSCARGEEREKREREREKGKQKEKQRPVMYFKRSM